MVKDDAQSEELLRIRASLGRWNHKDGRWILLTQKESSQFANGRKYQVKEHLKSFSPYRTYVCTENQINQKIQSIKLSGFVLTEPEFPQLQEFFRDGEIITSGMLFQESVFEEATPQTYMSPWEALINSRSK